MISASTATVNTPHLCPAPDPSSDASLGNIGAGNIGAGVHLLTYSSGSALTQ